MNFIQLDNFLLFAFASLMLNITPGNDMIYVATRSINQGMKAGVVSAIGIALGCFVHMAASIFGLSSIIAQSTLLFDIIKYAGALYLFYLGIKSIIGKPIEYKLNDSISVDNKKVLLQGIITNILNPKVALFFLAFLPQFVNFKTGNIPLQLTILGVWFNFSGTMVNILVAITLGKMGNWLTNFPAFWKWQSKITGGVLCALGLRLAFASRK
ncbi:MAG: LysE family translocator [Ignavibacteriales bacterium]|nr:LysE family translocator [Ignavibacteriales bacterium]